MFPNWFVIGNLALSMIKVVVVVSFSFLNKRNAIAPPVVISFFILIRSVLKNVYLNFV